MTELPDRHNPSFLLLPANNDRTAWRPFGLPVILAVPHSRDAGGLPLANSLVLDCLVVIEGAPNESLVAGPDHVGLRYPAQELFRQTLSLQEVLSRLITDIPDRTFIASRARTSAATGTPISPGQAITSADAQGGDYFVFTTTSGVTDQIEWYPDVDYYDLSDILIATEQLPARRYILAYLAHFYLRRIIDEGFVDPATNLEVQELLCIDVSRVGLAALRFRLNHPGEIINDMYRLTPALYFTAQTKATDPTLAFYRPFSDLLQDIHDEQRFLEWSNWVYKVPFQAIPYLAAQLGWDIPYFPASLDNLRRAVLRKTVELQKLKGSRRAIVELMSLFGYDILINNLWYSTDGKIFIEPNATLPPAYSAQQITYQERYQLEPLLAGYATSGFGQLTIPLLFTPQTLKGIDPFKAAVASGTVTLDAYLVPAGGPADQALAAICATVGADPEAFADQRVSVDQQGFMPAWPVHNAVAAVQDSYSYSQVLIANGQAVRSRQSGPQPPLALTGVTMDKPGNRIGLTFNGYLGLSQQRLYVFATYSRWALIVPPPLTNLFSNRFSIQLLSKADASPPPSDVIDFLLDFLARVKAFHSLLYLIRFRASLTESYQVTDFGVGGDVLQRYDTDAGRQQVPPAIIPLVPGEHCEDFDPVGLGYKPTDLLYRQLVLGALLEEWEAWKAQDGRGPGPALTALLLAPLTPQGSACQYTTYGQDLVTSARQLVSSTGLAPPGVAAQSSAASESDLKPSPVPPGLPATFLSTNSDSSEFGPVQVDGDARRPSFCQPDGTTDYCYRGRVADQLLSRLTLAADEVQQGNPCGFTMGNGVYWTYPVPATIGRSEDVLAPRPNLDVVSGLGDWPDHGPATTNLTAQVPIGPNSGAQTQADQLAAAYATALPAANFSWLGRLNRAYDLPRDVTLHYDNRRYLGDPRQWRQLALLRPGLNIKQPTMHLPGCRFPTMNKLATDFVHPLWRGKPWDDPYTRDVPCCQGVPTLLGARLIVEPTSGTQDLAYQDVPFTVTANGLEPDISSLGGHTVPSYLTASAVVHRVYSAQLDASNHPAISFDQIEAADTAELLTNQPLFPSAAPTRANGVNEFVDYVDGYPAATGFLAFTATDLDRNGLYYELFLALGLPRSGIDETGAAGTAPDSTGSTAPALLFLASSGIRIATGTRLDCGCLLTPQSPTAGINPTHPTVGHPTEGMPAPPSLCSIDLYTDQDGNLDFSSDHLWLEQQLVGPERVGVSSWRLDGSIPTLLEIH